MKKNSKTTKLQLIIVLTIIVLCLSIFAIKLYFTDQETTTQPIISVVEKKEPMDNQLRTLYLSNKSQNNDYQGQLIFDNLLIPSLPIVKTYQGFYNSNNQHYCFYSFNGKWITENTAYTDGCDGFPCNPNDVYLSMDWVSKNYDRFGSNFIDYRNTLNDKNIIIYGHHASRVYFGDEVAETMQFTNLDKLINKENYKGNEYLEFILDNEIRRYEIVSVFKMNVEDENDLEALRTDWEHDYNGNQTANYFDTYYKHIKSKEYYSTGVKLTKEDNILTLITCIQGQSDTLREVVVCKEIERTYFID